ncbi:hypothetical protein V6N13_130048 [Hibiscus sabdariffa]|uniref:Uncharacterized protein n=1 Tax=Hibiscus sabdariffa TaxID=183260 RepID=A0ABR2SN96_9ROSI
MKTRDPAEKQTARDRKEEAEKRKQEARDQKGNCYTNWFCCRWRRRELGTQGQGYSAIGSQDYRSRNWEGPEPNNATRRNVGENDPYHGTNE